MQLQLFFGGQYEFLNHANIFLKTVLPCVWNVFIIIQNYATKLLYL
jgi:hypothetical protein